MSVFVSKSSGLVECLLYYRSGYPPSLSSLTLQCYITSSGLKSLIKSFLKQPSTQTFVHTSKRELFKWNMMKYTWFETLFLAGLIVWIDVKYFKTFFYEDYCLGETYSVYSDCRATPLALAVQGCVMSAVITSVLGTVFRKGSFLLCCSPWTPK